ncbi:MAG: hypothetical protein HY885_17285 [Deltaproteobacteria bacterium]|nr:hypothetical protein [Deltaproteobacteria bacterium]
MFNINYLRVYVFLSLAAVLLLPSYIYFSLSPQFAKLIVKNAEREAERVTNHLIAMFLADEPDLSDNGVLEEMTRAEERVMRDFQLEKLKLFSANGEVVYSSDKKDIGARNTNGYFSEVVAKGKPFAKLVKKGRESLEGMTVPVDVLEIYMPVMRAGKFVGAFEIYYDVTEAQDTLHRLMSRVYGVLFLISAGLMCAVVFIYFRASRNMAKQRELDQEKERNYQAEAILNNLLELSLVTISLQEILEIFIHQISSIPWLDVEPRGMVFLVGADRAVLELAAQRDMDEATLSRCARVAVGTCVCGRAAATGECHFSSCTGEFHDIIYEPMAPHGHYCVPILSSKGVVQGVITLYTRAGVKRNQRAEATLLAAANLLAAIIERKRAEEDREKLISDLQQALTEIKALQGIIPICSFCKQIRDDKGYWQQVEQYIGKHSAAQFSHSICPQCMKEKYPELAKEDPA